MALILNIDTAVQSASVCLAEDEKILASMINPSEKESASWLHLAIKDLLHTNGYTLHDLNAIAITEGPGSYTGLRVGMATAKGLCYALSKPLITINSLQNMAASLISSSTELRCPMIDARRLEVFTALFDNALNIIMPSTNMILSESSFEEWLQTNRICFFGNGSKKAAALIKHSNAVFIDCNTSAENMVSLSVKKFEQCQFSNLAYSEPLYGKAFYSPLSKKIY